MNYQEHKISYYHCFCPAFRFICAKKAQDAAVIGASKEIFVFKKHINSMCASITEKTSKHLINTAIALRLGIFAKNFLKVKPFSLDFKNIH